MVKIFRGALWLVIIGSVVAASAGAAEEKRTEEMTLLRVKAANVLVLLRGTAGAREIEILDPHTLSVRDTPEKLLLVRKVVEMLDRPEDQDETPATYEVGDGTMIACVALHHAAANMAMRMLMSEIGIRRVASVEEISTVLVRDTAEQVEKALALLRDFDRATP